MVNWGKLGLALVLFSLASCATDPGSTTPVTGGNITFSYDQGRIGFITNVKDDLYYASVYLKDYNSETNELSIADTLEEGLTVTWPDSLTLDYPSGRDCTLTLINVDSTHTTWRSYVYQISSGCRINNSDITVSATFTIDSTSPVSGYNAPTKSISASSADSVSKYALIKSNTIASSTFDQSGGTYPFSSPSSGIKSFTMTPVPIVSYTKVGTFTSQGFSVPDGSEVTKVTVVLKTTSSPATTGDPRLYLFKINDSTNFANLNQIPKYNSSVGYTYNTFTLSASNGNLTPAIVNASDFDIQMQFSNQTTLTMAVGFVLAINVQVDYDLSTTAILLPRWIYPLHDLY